MAEPDHDATTDSDSNANTKSNSDEPDPDPTTTLHTHRDEINQRITEMLSTATNHLHTQTTHQRAHIDRLERENARLRELLDRDNPPMTDQTDAAEFGLARLFDTTPHGCALANAIQNGAGANADRVYPVHERAWTTLRHLWDWACLVRTDAGDAGHAEWALDLAAPVVRDGLAAERGEDISSTQTRRVFETIADWGAACPSPPTLDKTDDGVLRLRIADGQAVSTVLVAARQSARR